MKRMSNLPVAEMCGMSDQLQKDVESSNAFRSTVFHKFCETGEWPKEINKLSEQDRTEIGRWKVPNHFVHEVLGLSLLYKNSDKERLLALDSDFNFIPNLPNDISQEDLEKVPNLMTAGHLDMAWDIPELDLVVIFDIKSSIFAVKDKCESLQLHAYGLAYAKLKGRSKYITGIWDASEGEDYWGKVYEVNTFSFEAIKDRIRTACNNTSTKYTRGTHCGSCWKRDSCPAHLTDLGDENRFKKIFDGTGTEKDFREALIAVKGLGELANKVTEACRGWAERHGGIRSEDGRKSYRPIMMKGRKSLDEDAVAAKLGVRNLDAYRVSGNDFRKFDWILVKEKK